MMVGETTVENLPPSPGNLILAALVTEAEFDNPP